MDGLMLDTERLALASVRKAGSAIGIHLTEDILMDIIGLNEAAANMLIEERLGMPINRKEFASAFYADYQETIKHNGIPLKKGIIELIESLEKNNIRRAVATSTKTELALNKLKIAGIVDKFEIIIGGDQVKKGKPAPDPYLKAAHELGVHVDNCLAMEDSDNGAMSAYTAGINVIVVPDIKQPSFKTREIALNICDSLFEVNKYLQLGGFLLESEENDTSLQTYKPNYLSPLAGISCHTQESTLGKSWQN